MTTVAVLTLPEITRATTAAWKLDRDVYAERLARQGRSGDVDACSRTAFAEIYRYDDLRDVPQPVWTFTVEERRHIPSDLTGDTYPAGLHARGDTADYLTWRECFDAAFAAVRELRGCPAT